MALDNEPSLKDMIYLNFPELPSEKLANELHFCLLKREVKCED